VYQLWYTHRVDRPHDREPILCVVFDRTAAGNEPVREWLLDSNREDRRAVGQDIKTAQYGWPLGIPLIRKFEPGLWEVAADLRTARQRMADLR
jgi:hypothetical protein